MRIITGYSNTKKSNGEDFALTPYFFLVNVPKKIIGLGLCFGWWSFYVAIGFNIPENIPFFINHDKIKE